MNLLVRREADQVGQVLDVGTALREAAASLAGDELRALTRQRRQLTAAVTARARAVAAESGQRLTQAVADQVEATLTAAILDEQCGRAVRSGLLVTALAATGVDEVDLGSAVAAPGGARVHRHAPRVAAGAAPRAAGRPRPGRRRQGARHGARGAGGRGGGGWPQPPAGSTRRPRASHDLEARSLQVQGEIDELRRRLAELEEQAEDVDEELEDAEGARSEAEEVVLEARGARDAAAAAIARLEGSGTEPVSRPAALGAVACQRRGVKRRSSRQASRSWSVEAHTPAPSPARKAAPSTGGLEHDRALDRDAQPVGLPLAEQVVGRRGAVHPHHAGRGQGCGQRREHVPDLGRDRLRSRAGPGERALQRVGQLAAGGAPRGGPQQPGDRGWQRGAGAGEHGRPGVVAAPGVARVEAGLAEQRRPAGRRRSPRSAARGRGTTRARSWRSPPSSAPARAARRGGRRTARTARRTSRRWRRSSSRVRPALETSVTW